MLFVWHDLVSEHRPPKCVSTLFNRPLYLRMYAVPCVETRSMVRSLSRARLETAWASSSSALYSVLVEQSYDAIDQSA